MSWTDRDDVVLGFLHAAGDTPVQIARWMGRSTTCIRRRARRQGLAFEAKRRAWSNDELETIRINYPDFPTLAVANVLGRTASSVHQVARKMGLKKSRKFMAGPWANRFLPGDESGKAHRFKKGHVPANKGLRRPGFAPGRMAETQFKKGCMAGAAQHNYVPIGTEKVDRKRNVLMRKITDDPALFPANRWRPVHVLVWESVHGPIPPGHICIFRRGMKTFKAEEITVDRLELVTHAENMRRNTIHRYPEEVKDAMRLVGRVKKAARTRHEEQDRGSAEPPVRRAGRPARSQDAVQPGPHARGG